MDQLYQPETTIEQKKVNIESHERLYFREYGESQASIDSAYESIYYSPNFRRLAQFDFENELAEITRYRTSSTQTEENTEIFTSLSYRPQSAPLIENEFSVIRESPASARSKLLSGHQTYPDLIQNISSRYLFDENCVHQLREIADKMELHFQNKTAFKVLNSILCISLSLARELLELYN